MIQNAVLLANSRNQWGEIVTGRTILERQLFTLARAGLQKAWIQTEEPSGLKFSAPPGLQVFAQPEDPFPRSPRIVLSGDFFVRMEVVRDIKRRRTGIACHDEFGETVLRVVFPDRSDGEESALSESDCIGLRGARKESLLAWLLAGLRKDSDGFMARHFDRNISLVMTRQLIDTWVRPNHMTLLSTWIGLSGAVQFIFSYPHHGLVGALLIWLHTVLDGCDGEMARLTFQESRWGAWIDFWGDNLVHVALFGCLAVHLRGQEPYAPTLGTLACAGALGSALGSAWISARKRSQSRQTQNFMPVMNGLAEIEESGWGEKLKRLELFLAQRDFVYLLVLSAIFHKENYFLWAAGLGTPIYMAILLFLVLHQARAVPPSTTSMKPTMTPKESL